MTATNVKKVAVIGAGISGVCTAAHLLENGLEVVVLERSSIAGGVWHFDQRTARDPSSYPNQIPSHGDFEPVPDYAYSTPPPEEGDPGDLEIVHAPPGPCYAGLKNNVSTREMEVSLGPWPLGIEDFVSQSILEEYIQGIAREHRVDAVTQYHTRVEEAKKDGERWLIRTTTLTKSRASARLVQRHWVFDAVVVASGHYHMPRIPDFPGLKEWKRAWPDRVWHSKKYRTPSVLQDQTVLLVGAGVSAVDIAKESAKYAKQIYQSARGGLFDLPATVLPEGVSRVGAIKAFEHDVGRVTLESGETLDGIDVVILCTGYITSYPFLAQFHRDDLAVNQADERVLVTGEGHMNHNLHKDMFYIEDPSLVFVGAPYHVATFSLFDFQAQAVARVLSAKAKLPSHTEMRREYGSRVKSKGLGREFHSLKAPGAEEAYVRELVDWMNAGADRLGVKEQMLGHTPAWHLAKKERDARIKLKFAVKEQVKKEESVSS